MLRHRLRLVVLGLAGLAAGGASLLIWLTPPRNRINPEGFDAIVIGMTEQEVERVLGVPPGDHARPRTFIFKADAGRINFSFGSSSAATYATFQDWFGPGEGWLGDNGFIHICLDDKGHVLTKAFACVYNVDDVLAGRIFMEERVVDRVRRWLGL